MFNFGLDFNVADFNAEAVMWAYVNADAVKQLFTDPLDWTDVDGNTHPASMFNGLTAPQLLALGVYPAVYADSSPTRFAVPSNPVGVVSGNSVNVTRTWASPTLAAAQAAAHTIIDRARQVACGAGTTISGVLVTTDPYSIMLIIGYYIAALQDAAFTATWEISPGVNQVLTNAQIKSFAPQVLAFLKAQFATAATRQAAVAAAATVAAIETLLQGYGL